MSPVAQELRLPGQAGAGRIDQVTFGVMAVGQLVTGMSSSVPMFGHGASAMVYGATIRDRGTGSTMVRAGRSIR